MVRSLTEGEFLALTESWWVWKHDDIRKAINAATLWTTLQHFRRGAAPVRPEQLLCGCVRGTPAWANREELATLGRDKRHVVQTLLHNRSNADDLLIGLAIHSGIERREFYPLNADAVALATSYLIDRPSWTRGLNDAALAPSRAYAAFRLRRPYWHRAPTTEEVLDLLDRERDEDRSLIRSAAQALGIALPPVDVNGR